MIFKLGENAKQLFNFWIIWITFKLKKEQIKTDEHLCLKKLFKSAFLTKLQIFGKNDEDFVLNNSRIIENLEKKTFQSLSLTIMSEICEYFSLTITSEN